MSTWTSIDLTTVVAWIGGITGPLGTLLALWRLRIARQELQHKVKGTRYKDLPPYGHEILALLSQYTLVRLDNLTEPAVRQEITARGIELPYKAEGGRLRAHFEHCMDLLESTQCITIAPDGVIVIEENGHRAIEHRAEHKWWKIWKRAPF